MVESSTAVEDKKIEIVSDRKSQSNNFNNSSIKTRVFEAISDQNEAERPPFLKKAAKITKLKRN